MEIIFCQLYKTVKLLLIDLLVDTQATFFLQYDHELNQFDEPMQKKKKKKEKNAFVCF